MNQVSGQFTTRPLHPRGQTENRTHCIGGRTEPQQPYGRGKEENICPSREANAAEDRWGYQMYGTSAPAWLASLWFRFATTALHQRPRICLHCLQGLIINSFTLISTGRASFAQIWFLFWLNETPNPNFNPVTGYPDWRFRDSLQLFRANTGIVLFVTELCVSGRIFKTRLLF